MQDGKTTRVCAYCQQEKTFAFSGRKLKDGSKVYLDDKGQRWAGRRCPECERARVQAAVRTDGFDKEIIARSLEDAGYVVGARSLPLVVKKDGKEMRVAIKRAHAQGGKIVIETPVEGGAELVALVFESVRVVTRDQLERLGDKLGVYEGVTRPTSPLETEL